MEGIAVRLIVMDPFSHVLNMSILFLLYVTVDNIPVMSVLAYLFIYLPVFLSVNPSHYMLMMALYAFRGTPAMV